MASSAGARITELDPKKKKKSPADALLFSNEGESTNKLAGINIKIKVTQSLARMAPYLGLPNGDAVKTVLESPEFRPWFEELYHAAIYPRTLKAPNSKPPSLLTAQKKILRGKTFGDRKYSSVSLNKTGWEEADHYASCLYRLCVENTLSRNGLFRKHQMSMIEKETRMWMCIIRATLDANRLITRTKAQKRKNLSIDEDSSVGELLDQPSASVFGYKSGNLIPDINSTPCKLRKQHQFSSPQSSLMDKSDHPMRSLDQAIREGS
ncbi:hypothetical protein BOTNAR_0002g00610 [Botryotinia narcissicola]|uniref:Uncharacterized protein n=1 Tax=Botryotinia narcissicola TaxID=278944 RepID=A0A4Z1JMY0_9HELO|nr:hypothetical protein BOTNAR_0002g00610 [Botryotinia narcissicola]